MGFGYSGPENFVKDPSEAQFVADFLADSAGDGQYSRRRAYLALRSLSPQDLFTLYSIWREDGNNSFRTAFGPFYHRAAGDAVEGPLFEAEAVQ